ncbi:hypothetical protein, partial [Leptolyngbya sp. FACHB-16]|uniref:hypothetical protein n=1 Tax=unclassified Leptolyngbya TaxID=2650499 RepID=UPI001A7E9ABA
MTHSTCLGDLISLLLGGLRLLIVKFQASNSQYGPQSQEFTPYGRELLALRPENCAPLARS